MTGCAEAEQRDVGPLGLAPDDELIRNIDSESDLRNATIELPSVGQVEVLYRVVGDQGFWSGDILLGSVDEIDNGFRAATISSGLWPNKTVLYRWDPGIAAASKAFIKEAMSIWEGATSVRFVENNDAAGGYALFSSDDEGCYSDVGYHGEAKVLHLNINDGPDCDSTWVSVHELGHLLGMWHEHSREDRDQHINIDWTNIEDGQASEFDKYSKEDSGVDRGPYDFKSVMNYDSYLWAKDFSKPVMTKKNGDTWVQPEKLSAGDAAGVEAMYAGVGAPPKDDEGDGDAKPGSCSGKCSSGNPITAGDGTNCYCDAGCVEYGDCCDDREASCGAPPKEPEPDKPATCAGHCNEATGVSGPDGKECYCDEVCTGNGDCCADYVTKCGGDDKPEPEPGPMPGPDPGSCAGQCGSDQPQGDCYCDTLCIDNSDCCSDYAAECG